MTKCITFVLAFILWTTCAQAQQTWSVGANGWTVFNGSPGTGTCGNHTSNYTGTCQVVVDPILGSDATCVAQVAFSVPTPAQTCATPGHAQTLLRNGSPDWLLLTRGRQYSIGLDFGVTNGQGAWCCSGRSANEPMLIGGYGTGANPLFVTNGVDASCYSTTANRGQFMAIQGIDCYNDFSDPNSATYLGTTQPGDMSSTSPTIANIPSTSAIQVGYIAYASGINGLAVTAVTANSVTLTGNPGFTAPQRPIQYNKPSTQTSISLQGITNFLIFEGNKIRFGGLVVQNNPAAPVPGVNFRIRRNTILDSYGQIGHGSNGVFLADNQLSDAQILIEENVVDHNGYNTAIWGAFGNVFSHNFYLHDWNPPITFRNNVTMEASATGAQVRNGGTITGNAFVNNPIGMTANPGINFNTTAIDQNVYADAGDMIIGQRIATAATAPGSNLLSMDGILTAGNGSFLGQRVEDLTNPGAIPLTAGMQTLTSTTVSLKTSTGVVVNVVGGANGLGIQAGDVLQIYGVRGQGVSLGPTGAFEPTTGTYPIGTTTFNLVSGALPSWVVPGMNVAIYSDPAAFTGGQTTILSVSGGSITTTSPSTGAINAAEQNVFVIWTPGNYANFPLTTFGPNNVFTGNLSQIPGYAYSPQDKTQNLQGNGNYYYNWNLPAQNIVDLGIPGTNQETPTLNVSGSTACPNATIESYDAAAGGPGTLAHFIAQARLQGYTNWNPLYTAQIVTSYIRGNIAGGNCAP